MRQMSLTEAIRHKLKTEDLTYKDAAAALGIDPSTMYSWTIGRRQPSKDYQEILSNWLGMTEQEYLNARACKQVEQEHSKARACKQVQYLRDYHAAEIILECLREITGLPGASHCFPKRRRIARPGHMTVEQADALLCIDRYTEALERAPWYEEIARECRLDLDGVRRVVKALSKLGFVEFGKVHFTITPEGREAARKLKA